MTKSMLKVNATMLERFVDFENFKSKCIQQWKIFKNFYEEEDLEKYVKHLEENRNIIGLGFGFVLKYVEASNTIFLENNNDDTFSFGVRFEDKDFTTTTVCLLNEQIKDYFGDKIINDYDVAFEIKK